MGNAQSASGINHQPHNRLSKPKTNTNSPPLAPRVVDSPSSLSSRYAHLSARDRQQVRSQLLSPVESSFRHTSSPNGDEDVPELVVSLQRPVSGDSRTNSLSCFGSTRGSATKLNGLAGSKVSLVSLGQAVDLETAIKIVQEVKKNASPEDLAALHEALETPAPCPSTRDSPVPEPVSRRTSLLGRPTSALLRRRSLITAPGVGTRNSGVEGIRRTWNSWKTPKMDPEEEAKWRPDMMGKSPLTRLAALDLAEDGRNSPTPRAQTPGELDYAHLGSFQLGSLRVTNGPASPSPSAKFRRRRSNPNLFSDGDYFTPSEPSDSPLMMKTTKRRKHSRSKSTIEPPTPPLYRRSLLSDQVRRAKTVSRCDELPTEEAHEEPIPDDTEPEPVRRLRVMNKSADTLAEALAREASTEISRDYDEGFVEDERERFQDEAFRILNDTIFNEPAHEVMPFDSEKETHQIPSCLRISRPITNRPPPMKADSGYSSGGSVRTLKCETSDRESASVLGRPSVSAESGRSGSSDSDASSSLRTFEHMPRSPVSTELSPPTSANDNVVSSPSTWQVPHAQPSSPISRVMELRSLECDSPKSPMSIASQLSVDSKQSGARKLQKRRPSFQELPIVESCVPVSEGTVPDVPPDVKQNFSRRLSESPNMDCLTQTYRSTDHINNDAASSVASVSIRSPSPPPSASSSQQDKPTAIERPTSSRPSIRRSLSLFRTMSKSKMHKKEAEQLRVAKEEPPIVLDLGSIAMSLGQSPYDAAMAPTRRKSVSSPTHPHQLGNAIPRTKSMVSMDAETAMEFARTRSKDRAISRPSMPPRPRSFHAITRRIPHDLDEEIPAVPPVPSLHLMKANILSVPPVPEFAKPVEQSNEQPAAEAPARPNFRSRTSGRGPVVAEIIEKFDQHGQAIAQVAVTPQDWQAHAELWSRRRKSIGEDLRQRVHEVQAQSFTVEQPPMPQIPAKYTGDGIRQLHSYASRRSRGHSTHRRRVSMSSSLVWP